MPPRTRRAPRLLLLTLAVLLAPVVPALFWGEAFAGAVERWQTAPPSDTLLAAAVTALLACDMLLPIPSTPLITLSGARLGWATGALCSTVGLTLGASVGFFIARHGGRAAARAWLPSAELASLEQRLDPGAPWLLFATRAVPLLAETTTLLAGLSRAPALPCLLSLGTGNAIVATIYAIAGDWGASTEYLWGLVVLSGLIPALLALFLSRLIVR